MTTLQEQFEKDFPDKSVEKIDAFYKYYEGNFTNYDLDLSEYVNLESLNLSYNKITSINLSEYKELRDLKISNNNLISIDFLNTLPCPEKLEELEIFSNKIPSTDISFFSKFVNLEVLRIGTNEGITKGKINRFYGSLKSWKSLTKLRNICIDYTD